MKTPAETPKTTDKPAQTGGGEPADAKATKEARKPARAKAKNEVSKDSDVPDPKPKGSAGVGPVEAPDEHRAPSR